MRLPPLHPLQLAARSTFGGRSSPEPAKPTPSASPCQGSSSDVSAWLRSSSITSAPEFTGHFSAHETVSQGAGVDYHAIHTMSSTLSGRGTDSPYGPGQYPVSQRYERPAGSRGPASHPRDPNLLLILTMERSALI